jgi:hypothetical protein
LLFAVDAIPLRPWLVSICCVEPVANVVVAAGLPAVAAGLPAVTVV